MVQCKDTLAIDFGTVNTYLSKGSQDKVSGIDLDGGPNGMATAILYRDGRPPLIGDEALQEFGDATESERRSYQLHMQFKPDIAVSPPSYEYAREFLSQLLVYADKRNLHLNPLGMQVVFGIPSQSSREFVETLTRVAKEAGFGQIQTLDEPKGALFFHMSNNEIPVKQALSGGLVVDFGGGTCDFAFLHRGQVKHSWGDFSLGGRLFDDLFFQWFLEQNPDALARMEEEDDTFFIHTYLCRELKEFFSRTTKRDRNAIVRKKIQTDKGDYGRAEELTWDRFVNKAQNYRISGTMRRHWQKLGIPLGRLASEETVDLPAWFRDCLCQGWRGGQLDKKSIRYAILTGGSSMWAFVEDIIHEELALEDVQIIRSSRPYAAISEGLAALPGLQTRFLQIKAELEADLPRFYVGTLQPLLNESKKKIAEEIAEQVAIHLFDEKLKPHLDNFRHHGGSVASLKGRMEQDASAMIPVISALIQEKLVGFSEALACEVVAATNLWLQESHRLRVDERNLDIGDCSMNEVATTDFVLPDVYKDIAMIVQGVSAVVGASVAATIAGGGGVALIAHGPLGLAIGAVLGALVAYLSLRYGIQKAKGMAEAWEAPAWLIKRTLTENRIMSVRADLKKQIAEKIIQGLDQMDQRLARQIEELARREIEALTEINQL